MSFLAGGLVSGIGSLIGGILGSNAAGTAAQQEIAAQQKGIAQVQQGEQNATGQQEAATNQITGELSPFLNLGTNSAQQLQQLLSPGGSLTQGYGNFNAPTAAQAAQQPGYQFALQQGEQALQNSAAASGGLLSTGTAKNLTGYAEGLASTNYNNVYNQALNTYGANQNTFEQNQGNLYNRLSATAGLGAGVGTSLGSLQQQGASQLNNVYTGTAQTLAQLLTGQGQSAAAGTVGSANALTGAIGGAANSLGSSLTLQQVLSQLQPQSSGYSALPGQLNSQTLQSLLAPGGVLSGSIPQGQSTTGPIGQ